MCRCLPVPLLKGSITVGAISTIVVGIAAFGGILGLKVSIFGFLHPNLWVNESQSQKNALVVFLLLASICCWIFGSLGLYGINIQQGSIRKKKIPLSCFAISTIVFAILFGGLAIGGFVASQKYFKGSCSQNTDQYVVKLKKTQILAQLLFCRNLCPCYYTRTDQNITVKIYMNLSRYNFSKDQSKPIRYQDCLGYTNAETQALGAIESLMSCAGWCPRAQGDYLYKFSSVNSGIPLYSGCYNYLQQFFHQFGNVIGITCLVIALSMGVLISCICGLVCHTDRKSQNIYNRIN